MKVSREAVRSAFRNDHAATCVLLAARWLQEHPDDLGITLDYAEMLFKMTHYEEAIRIYEDALRRMADEDTQWAICNQLGRLYRYRGDFAAAERWFRRAVEADPEQAASYVFLGAAQARQGKLDAAEQTHRAATGCPEGPIDEAYHNLGLVLRGQGRLAEAADCFRRAIEIDPDYEVAIEALEDVTTALALMAEEAD